MKIWQRLGVAFLIAIGLDGISKILAEQWLVLYQPIPVLGEYFQLTLGYNTGVAFGMFADGGSWPLIITGIVIFGLVIWLINALRVGELPPLAVWPMGLLLGGAIGNFVDRFPDGRVTDFLDVGLGTARWPTFNIADSFIVLALGTLMVMSMFNRQDEPAPPLNDAPPPRVEANCENNL